MVVKNVGGLEKKLSSKDNSFTAFARQFADFYNSEGSRFKGFLKAKGRTVGNITRIAPKKIDENTHLYLQFGENGHTLYQNPTHSLDQTVAEVSQHYDVPALAVKDYLFLHETAHTSQYGLGMNTYEMETDAEDMVARFANDEAIKAIQRGDLNNFKRYKAIQKIAEIRVKEVDHNYR